MKKKWSCTVFGLLFILIHGSFVSASEKIFRFRISEDSANLDWNYGEVNPMVLLQIMEGLVESGPKGEVIPAIALQWRKKTKLDYEFFLRKDVRWNDGQPVCAQSFVDSFERSKKMSLYVHLTEAIESMHAVGCHQLVLHLKRPADDLLSVLSHWTFFPIRKELQKTKLMTNGPYEIAEHIPDQKYVLKKNLKYYGIKKMINAPDRIEIFIISSDATALSLYRQKKLDWMKDIPYFEIKKIRADLPTEFYYSETLVEYFLGFNFIHGLDKESRCAVIQALDLKQIPSFLTGGEVPAYGFFPAINYKKPKKEYVYNGPKNLPIYYYSKEIHQPLMEWVQAQLNKNLKIDVELKKIEGKIYWSMLSRLESSKDEPSPPVFLSGLTAATTHPYSFASEFISSSKANWGKFNSLKYDQLAFDLAAGQKLKVKDLQKILLEDECVLAPLYFRRTASLINPKISRLQINPLGYVYLKNLRWGTK